MTIPSLIEARYGDAARGYTWHALERAPTPALETLLAHRSVRAFLPDSLETGTLELPIAAAQSAASSSNLQTWSVVAVEQPERKQRLSAFAGDQAHIRVAPLFLVWLVDVSRLSRIARRDARPSAGLDYLDTFLMGAIDAALAAQNAVVAAEALGLGTVYIGALRNRPEQVAAELGLPEHVFPLFGLCVGRPDPQRPAAIKPRLPQRSVLFRERYEPRAIGEDVDGYDEAMRRFYAAQQMPATRWSEVSSQRVESAEGLRGRHRLREALTAQGFRLL